VFVAAPAGIATWHLEMRWTFGGEAHTTRRAAVPPLLAAARRLETLDPAAARETYLSAIGAALNAGRFGRDDLAHAFDAAAAVPAGDEPAGQVLSSLITWHREGHEAAVPRFRRAVEVTAADGDVDLVWLSGMLVHEIWDDEAFLARTEKAVTSARDSGALSLLPTALTFRATALVYAGRFADASDLIDEAAALAYAGPSAHPAAAVILAAHRGQAEPALEQIEALAADAQASGQGWLLSVTGYSRAVLHNGLGNYPAALEAVRFAVEHDELAVRQRALSELVEAAGRTGDTAAAAQAREVLTELTRGVDTGWARGTRALADALAGPATQAGENYREAVDQLAGSRLVVPAARARLLYGEWLRRENRRGDAREQLRAAYDAFAAMGAEGFAERAGRELMATGETVRKRTLGVREELTAQEAQIARLAAAGRTNPEIGAVLFLSPRTVEWHLRKIFTKLGVTSRRELAGRNG
ncbi:LuxR C-terminal-related transcriptional regulator, partial [Actinoplanes sp. NPDC024001]|uniref:LuxR C-terminal-related transcriptional regulator n=1 Tax=Actinoplanes sp. NPDC024001 TaxID=3154598 RepID=UPI0033D41D09